MKEGFVLEGLCPGGEGYVLTLTTTPTNDTNESVDKRRVIQSAACANLLRYEGPTVARTCYTVSYDAIN